jgi:hypothetical protein
VEIKDRAMSARDSFTRKRLEHKLDGVREDNSELSVEKKALEERSRQDRHEIDRILGALVRVSTKGRRHRVRSLAALTVAAGGAYVMGAKAGRARFDQINGWWERARGKSSAPWTG